MPGMAASPAIFNGLKLDSDLFEPHRLEWFVPPKGISLQEYALEMCKRIQHEDAVLLGVSFGGMLVQEMAKHMPIKKVVAVSCVKTRYELPKRMLFAKYTKIHKFRDFNEIIFFELHLFKNYSL